MRQLAGLVGVHPNTLERMSKPLGFKSYEDFREPFREVLRRRIVSSPDRVRWLQRIGQGGGDGRLYSKLADTFMSNTAMMFSSVPAANMKVAAERMIRARRIYLVGMGNCYPLMLGCFYVVRMAFDNFTMVPHQAGLPVDDLFGIGPRNVMVAATCRPYRRETIESARHGTEQGATLISLTDSRTSPIAVGTDILLTVPTSTLQFFPSTLSMNTLLEVLLAFLVAESDENSAARIDAFYRKRRVLSVYWHGDPG